MEVGLPSRLQVDREKRRRIVSISYIQVIPLLIWHSDLMPTSQLQFSRFFRCNYVLDCWLCGTCKNLKIKVQHDRPFKLRPIFKVCNLTSPFGASTWFETGLGGLHAQGDVFNLVYLMYYLKDCHGMLGFDSSRSLRQA